MKYTFVDRVISNEKNQLNIPKSLDAKQKSLNN